MGEDLPRPREFRNHNAIANCGGICGFEHIQVVGVHAGIDVGTKCHGTPEDLSGRGLLSSLDYKPLNDQFNEFALHTGVAITADFFLVSEEDDLRASGSFFWSSKPRSAVYPQILSSCP